MTLEVHAKTLAITAAAFLLTACTETTSPTAGGSGTAADPLVGKTLISDDPDFPSVLVLNADGTLGGTARARGAVAGTYTANAREVCTTFSLPGRLAQLGRVCIIPVIEGDTVVFKQSNGARSVTYTIQG